MTIFRKRIVTSPFHAFPDVSVARLGVPKCYIGSLFADAASTA